MSKESNAKPGESIITLEPHDRRILAALKDGPKTAQEIAALMPVGWRGIHGTELVLEALERVGLMREKAGRWESAKRPAPEDGP